MATINLDLCSTLSCVEFGSDDIGRAAEICDRHRPFTSITPSNPGFLEGWEACAKVWNAWLESENGRLRAAAIAEEARQKSFVEEVARTLK